MSQLSLKPINLNDLTHRDNDSLKHVEKQMNQMTKEIANKDIELIQNQSSKINKFAQTIKQILENVTKHQTNCSNTISQLRKQVTDLTFKIKQYDSEYKITNKQKQFKKQIEQNQQKYLTQWQKRIQIASTVKTDGFLKVQIQDRKAKANQIFKWIIVAIYGQTDAKYYLPNFIEQVFERDQGVDFKQRLGKINASSAKQQAKIKTQELLKCFSQIQSSKQLQKVITQVQKIYQIAKIFLKCYDFSKKIKQLQAQIVKSRQNSQQKDQQAMRWKARSSALQDRIKTNNQYLSALKAIQSKLTGKFQSYNEKQNLAKQVVSKIKNHQNISELAVNIQDDKRDNCECRIF